MEWVPQWLLINGAGLAIILILVRLVARAKKREAARLAEEVKPEASARGWEVEATYTSDQTRLLRWSGRDGDVRWVGEDVYRKRGSPNRSLLEMTRWRTIDRRGPDEPIFLMGLPEGTVAPPVQPAEGLLMSMAVKAAFYALDKGLDTYFGVEIGKEVDAAALKRVEDVEAELNGYVVFAQNPAAARRVLNDRMMRAIRWTVDAGPESMRGYRRPWILFWRGGVALSRLGPARAAAELEPIVRAGVSLTRAVEGRE